MINYVYRCRVTLPTPSAIPASTRMTVHPTTPSTDPAPPTRTKVFITQLSTDPVPPTRITVHPTTTTPSTDPAPPTRTKVFITQPSTDPAASSRMTVHPTTPSTDPAPTSIHNPTFYWPSTTNKNDFSPNNTFCRASTMNYCIGSHAPKPSTHPALGTIATRLYAFNWPSSKDDCYFQLTQHQERMLPHQNLLLTHNNC